MSAETGVLLIGGRGFIGRPLARALADKGHRVHVLSPGCDPGTRDDIQHHRGSQDDARALAPLLDECDCVIHLASSSTPGSSAREPLEELEANLSPALRLIDRLAHHPPRRLVFVSSGGALYGNVEQLPARETAPVGPISYYAAGKVALEGFFSAFAHAHQVSLAIVRPSNLYGPGQDLRSGFGVIRTLMDRARSGDRFEVWGGLRRTRDYLYIDDAIDALLGLVEHADAGGTFNLGSGIGTATGELITAVENATGHSIDVIERPARKTDVDAIVLDSTRLRDAIGWQPRTPLPLGLEQTWRWLSREIS